MSKKTEERYKSLPAGVRNNNYLNIKKSASKWKGTRLPERSHPFVEFVSPEWGYRAAFIIMAKTYRKRGLKKVSQIIAAWAPNSENNTAMYISTVMAKLTLWLHLEKCTDYEMPDPVKFEPDKKWDSQGVKAQTAFRAWTSLARAMTMVEIGDKYAMQPAVPDYIVAGYKLFVETL